MNISGIQKTTLLDYPGKIACIIFTAGCNMRCRFCHNSEFVLPEKIREIRDFIPEDIFFNFLEKKRNLLDGVVVCGGEPTVHPDLYGFCVRIKEMGFLVKLDTNGRDPKIVKRLADEGIIDYVAMDIKGDFSSLRDLIGVGYKQDDYLETIDFLLHGTLEYEFRTTMIKKYHSLETFTSLLEQIQGGKILYLQNYRSGKTLDPTFFGESFSPGELLAFKKMAETYLKKCVIRI